MYSTETGLEAHVFVLALGTSFLSAGKGFEGFDEEGAGVARVDGTPVFSNVYP
jgi:hypothetical protein